MAAPGAISQPVDKGEQLTSQTSPTSEPILAAATSDLELRPADVRPSPPRIDVNSAEGKRRIPISNDISAC